MEKKIIASVLLMTSFTCAYTIEDFCSANNYDNIGALMQFTKEATDAEYAITGKFKGLHCCAKGYRSIVWYKDGVQYPWPSSISELIVYPESANQTVYTKTITENDAGEYKCVLTNDSEIREHVIRLSVFEKDPDDDPKITYISRNQSVAIGEHFRLFCEAFAGRVDLPDAHNEAVWRKMGHNGTIHDDARVQQKKISRENGQTFGTYLMIKDVQARDFGVYTCEISIPGRTIKRYVKLEEKIAVEYINPNPVPVTKLLFVMSAIAFVIVVIFLLNLRYGLKLRVRFKDSFSTLEQNDGKTSDILIVYAAKDAEIALEVLLPTLENTYQYKCASRELPANVNSWYTDLQGATTKSRRMIAVVSPACVHDNWNTTKVLEALKQLQALESNLICIALKEMPSKENETKNSQGETLTSFLRRIHVIGWDAANQMNFWYSLRLRLPPKRRGAISNLTQADENTTRLNSDSQESLNSLV